jgi:uncharacterized Zn finger protein (UPF0148 family)
MGKGLTMSNASDRPGTFSGKCPVCSAPLFRLSGYKPKTYCSGECKDTVNFMSALYKSIDKVLLHADKSSKKKLKGELFRLANQIK